MVQQPEEELTPQRFSLRLDWRVADEHPISFANHFMVQIAEDEFILTLGQLAPPALVNPTREDIEALPETISPKVVSRIVVTPRALRRFIKLLQQQMDLYDSGTRGWSETQGAVDGDDL